jgi:hypothetical protein
MLVPKLKDQRPAGRSIVAAAVDEPVEAQCPADVGEVCIVANENEKAVAGLGKRARDGLRAGCLLHGLKDVKQKIRRLRAGNVAGTP